MEDFGRAAGWLDAELEAQGNFLLGLAAIAGAVLLRRKGMLRPEDAVPLSKVTFNLLFPCMLFAKIWKSELSLTSLWRVGAVSTVVNVVQAALVHLSARWVPQEGGLRGQWVFCMSGSNIGFTYPLLLAARGLPSGVFSAVVIWDLAGNAPVILVLNYVTAALMAPKGKMQAVSEPTGDAEAGVPSGAASADAPGLAKEAPCGGVGGPVCTSTSESGTPASPQQVELDFGVVPSVSLGSRPRPCERLGAGVMLWRIATNMPLLAEVLAVVVNVSGIRVPKSIDSLAEGLGQPFGVLLFLLIGVNLVWATVKPQLGRVFVVVVARLCVGGAIAAIVCGLGVLPEGPARQAALFALFCPISGLAMSYALDFGYDGSLQAALMVTSNMVSFVILWALIAFF